jgi:hypothetical protein
MASRAETIRIPARSKLASKDVRHVFASAVREWFRKGQLGTSYTTDMGRYTGSRF